MCRAPSRSASSTVCGSGKPPSRALSALCRRCLVSAGPPDAPTRPRRM